MDEICAFVATTCTRQSGGQARNVQYRYVRSSCQEKTETPSAIYQELFLEFAAAAAAPWCPAYFARFREGLSCKYEPRFVACIAF